jgi:hypothetical protein
MRDLGVSSARPPKEIGSLIEEETVRSWVLVRKKALPMVWREDGAELAAGATHQVHRATLGEKTGSGAPAQSSTRTSTRSASSPSGRATASLPRRGRGRSRG